MCVYTYCNLVSVVVIGYALHIRCAIKSHLWFPIQKTRGAARIWLCWPQTRISAPRAVWARAAVWRIPAPKRTRRVGFLGVRHSPWLITINVPGNRFVVFWETKTHTHSRTLPYIVTYEFMSCEKNKNILSEKTRNLPRPIHAPNRRHWRRRNPSPLETNRTL